MKMKIRRYFINKWFGTPQNAKYGGHGKIIEMPPLGTGESGWESVEAFQKDRMRALKNHPYEVCEIIKSGVKITKNDSFMGLTEIHEITLSP